MIKKILLIRNFGVFNDYKVRDFVSGDFKEKNVIYGWNYSGKTTLSRLFSSLRDKKLHVDYPDAEFELKLDDDSQLKSSEIESYNSRVFVFNKEYVDSNLIWDSKKEFGDPITFDVGENTDIRLEIDRLERGIEFVRQRKIISDNPIRLFKEFDNSFFTDWSKNIRSIVSRNTESFDKGHFKSILKRVNEDSIDSLLIEQEKEIEYLEVLSNSTNSFEEYEESKFRPNFKSLESSVDEVLRSEPPKDVIIDIFEKDKDLYDWAEKGLGLHENEEVCSFCGNSITQDRVSDLNNYFSNASKELRGQIHGLRKRINTEIESVNNLDIPKSKNDFTEKERSNIDSIIKSYIPTKTNYISELSHLLNELARKEDGSIFNSITLSKTDYKVSEFEDWFAGLNLVIKRHNSFIQNFEVDRDNARERLKKHLIANYLKSHDYFLKKTKYESAVNWQRLYDHYIHTKEIEKTKLLDSLKNITKGKEKLNGFIQKFLGAVDIRIDVTNEDKFILLT